MKEIVKTAPSLDPPPVVTDKVAEFLSKFKPFETNDGTKLNLFFDQKSGTYYLTCHLQGGILAQCCDTEASLDAEDEDEIYKLNREIQEDPAAFQLMQRDAVEGRSFEDIVLEYDTSYRTKKPLKVYGGQHRLTAISRAESQKSTVLHGVRIYFGLTRDQKVEIATINNTAISVPNDLLDRMREQLLGSQLRDWCQAVDLLDKGHDFADKRMPDTPTVRLARTLIVNFYSGIAAANVEQLHHPILCKSGGVDDDYMNMRDNIDWSDSKLIEMGGQFARLHKIQRDTVSKRDDDNNAEFARKALSLSVVASWAYASGLFQRNADYLQILYSLPDNVVSPADPLNAKALSQARFKGTDPDTYRGLGTRSGPRELGRMLEVFLVLATKGKKRIVKDLANAAIQSYEAKRASHEAAKVLGRI
ncbi:MAG TPA: hypothetical protein VNW97_14915 [Candidatus Saccharimonadales bacterium]|jgi:hypothetical protein|nr:hypothetical protein [Candidatus Saccharimonadales bacterium]